MKSSEGKKDKKSGSLRQAAKNLIDWKMDNLEKIDGFVRRKEQNKKRILGATRDLIAKYGIDKLSISDIARQADVSQVTIYNLFGGKDQLINDYILAETKPIFEHFSVLVSAKKPYKEKLAELIQWVIEVTEAHPEFGDLEVIKNQGLTNGYEAFIEPFMTLINEFYLEGKKENFWNPELSDDATKAYFRIFLQGMIANPDIHARTHHDPKFLRDILITMINGPARKNI